MDRLTLLGTAVLLLPIITGCNSETESSTAQQAASASAPENYPTDPREVVTQFLDASIQGDPQRGSQYLTPLAIQKTREFGMDVFLGSGEKAQFEVGQVEKVDATTVHVQSVWTELDMRGRPQSAELFWVLKQDQAVWRISGMLRRLSPTSVIQVNYEDPEGMARQAEMLQEEKNRQPGENSEQARQGVDVFQAGRK